MSITNLRRYFSDIQETLPKGLKDIDVEEQKEQTLAQVRMDLELLQMMHEHIKTIRQKKEAIVSVQGTIKARNAVISEFTELVSTMSEQFKKLGDQSIKENTYLYSPYNNTKPLSSFEILYYAKRISHSLQAPKNYVPDSLLPNNFVFPFPTEDHIFHTYIYFNSRTDGKAPQKCQTPHHSVTNKMDIASSDGKLYHMIRHAAVLITANDPKDCTIIYTMDESIPTPFDRERQMGNGETIQVVASCILKVMACKPGFLDSDILELEFNIDKIDELRDPNLKSGVNNAEFAQRPDILADTKISGGIEFLDTPYSLGRTPSYSFTPSYTPSYYRDTNTKDQDH